MRSKLTLQALSALILAVSAFAQEPAFYLKDGDRVVFYGDSITDQRLYTTFTETYVVTRFPKRHITFVHSGWGGDRVTGGGGGPIDRRLERDVFAYKPSVMTVMLGMNDGSYRAFDEGIFNQYKTGYEHIVDAVKRALPDIRMTLIEPSPYDDVTQPPKFEGGYNSVLVRYGHFVKELASRQHLDSADLNTAVVAALEKAKLTDPELAKKIIPDRVHPGPAGHLLMAAELLKAWHGPKIVTSVEIDAANQQVADQKSTRVSGLKAGEKITWTQIDEALPMPVDMSDSVMALAINSSDFLSALDQQRLKVSGLKADHYTLLIDGSQAGDFTKDQLANGINLAPLQTPMLKQAMDVHKLTLEHNNIHFARWRQVQVPLANQKSLKVQSAVKELMAALDEEEAAVIEHQLSAAQPIQHTYELAPQ